MKIRYWGSAAAEGVPGIFCHCPVCREARAKGGRFVRARTQAVIDDALLVDLGADTYLNSVRFGFDLSQIGDVLITHAHSDHFYPHELLMRMAGYAHDMKYETLNVSGSDGVIETFRQRIDPDREWKDIEAVRSKRIAFNELKAFETARVGEYDVTPLPANHGTVHPFNYIIRREGKSILYLHDTGWPLPETMEYLSGVEGAFGLISYDCCGGDVDYFKTFGGGHMGLRDDIRLRAEFEKMGRSDEKTIGVATHFSHNGKNVGYDEFARVAAAEGFVAGYDGLQLEF